MKDESRKSESLPSKWSFIETSRAIILAQSPASKTNNVVFTSSPKIEGTDNLGEVEADVRAALNQNKPI